MMPWKIQSQSYIHKCKWLNLRRDKVLLPNGIIIDDYYVVECPNWVNVIAITNEGKMLLEQQYRHGLNIISYEICAGMIEGNETPLAAAQRELLEETGYSGGEWVEYGRYAPNPSSMTNINYTFLAKGVKKISNQKLEATEDISIHLFSVDEVKKLMIDGKIIQGVMMAPLWRYIAEFSNF